MIFTAVVTCNYELKVSHCRLVHGARQGSGGGGGAPASVGHLYGFGSTREKYHLKIQGCTDLSPRKREAGGWPALPHDRQGGGGRRAPRKNTMRFTCSASRRTIPFIDRRDPSSHEASPASGIGRCGSATSWRGVRARGRNADAIAHIAQCMGTPRLCHLVLVVLQTPHEGARSSPDLYASAILANLLYIPYEFKGNTCTVSVKPEQFS